MNLCFEEKHDMTLLHGGGGGNTHTLLSEPGVVGRTSSILRQRQKTRRICAHVALVTDPSAIGNSEM